jgi:hypothetical protein
MAITANTANWDPELFLIIPPTTVTIASQTVIDNTLNGKIYGYNVNNTTGAAATLTIKDGDDNEFITEASFEANQSQFIEMTHGYYMKNGIKVESDTDDALIVWWAVKKM